MRLITFEPGDGISYRILFGRLPGHGLVPHYTVFGVAEGSNDPGAWYAFDHEQVSEDVFYDHINPFATLERSTYLTAWRAWLALTGQADDDHAATRLPPWRPTWREQLREAREARL
jgi:hypothetical protein